MRLFGWDDFTIRDAMTTLFLSELAEYHRYKGHDTHLEADKFVCRDCLFIFYASKRGGIKTKKLNPIQSQAFASVQI